MYKDSEEADIIAEIQPQQRRLCPAYDISRLRNEVYDQFIAVCSFISIKNGKPEY